MPRPQPCPDTRRGAAAVELAILLPFLVVMLAAPLEVGRFVQVQQVLNNAAREGARLASQGLTINKDSEPTEIHVNTGSPNIESTVRNYLREAGINTTGLAVTFTFLDGDTTRTQPYQATKNQRYRIDVSLPFSNVNWTFMRVTSITHLRAGVEGRSLVDDRLPWTPASRRGETAPGRRGRERERTMTRLRSRREPRGGTTLVEFAFAAAALVMVVFGIFEYSRFVFLLQVAENAAREGARYAVVHTGDGTTKQQVIDEVTRRMAGRQGDLVGYDVEVLNVNPDTGAQISGTQWNDAAFGNSISVRITGNYKPLLPVLLHMSSTIPVRITSMMASEAN